MIRIPILQHPLFAFDGSDNIDIFATKECKKFEIKVGISCMYTVGCVFEI